MLVSQIISNSAVVQTPGSGVGGPRGIMLLGFNSLHIGPFHFEQPLWLALIPVLGGLAVLMARKSISGLGSATRWSALAIRLIVIALLSAALAEPSWRRESRDVAVTVVLDASESVPTLKQAEVTEFMARASAASERKDDRMGVVTAGREAIVQAMPTRLNKELVRQNVGLIDATNLAAAVRMAIAVMPKDAANRILLATDGNETIGSLLQAAEVAKALDVPIDVLPLRYKYDSEVLVDRLTAPASAREGENINLHVVLKSIRETTGKLTILQNGQALSLATSGDGASAAVALKAGLNVLQVPVTAVRSGPQKFEAVFEPDLVNGRPVGDSVLQNNKALAVTFVSGEGRVLVLSDSPEVSQHLVAALESRNIRTETLPGAQAPRTLTEFNSYDAVVMVNQSAFPYTQEQQEALRQYVHDTGGGLLMVGGPDTFGAGGWIGSPLEDALPVNLDIPSKRQMPKGALALVIHSCEMPEGVFYGKKVCQSAVESLSRLDLVGIVEYGWQGGTSWVHKLAPVGDGVAVKRAINNLVFGDMPDFTPSLELAYVGLKNADAGQKHVIIISDGDPQIPPTSLLDRYLDSRITISTVGVFPHGGADTNRMKTISSYTKGRHYEVVTQNALATIPQIFMKEAQTVRRSLLWEGAPFSPSLVPGLSDSVRGMTAVPPISGYVVTAAREGLALVSMKGKEGDPILAQWQYGLGKSVAFTSDAASRWNSSWIAWPGYAAFWEQNVRWLMRPGGSANVRVVTENKGDQTVVTVEALDSKGERLNFASFKGRLALPDGAGKDVELRQVGPGRYQGLVSTERAGSYVLSLRYAAPDDKLTGGVIEGSVQAAISRPFADEYRTMEDNMPLLTQVATMTGGRVLDWKPESEDVWSRDNLKMPVALDPIWRIIAVLGVGLFLLDVGVRRVRIDIPAIYRSTLALFGRGQSAAGQQLGGLRAAKDAAKAKIDKRAAGASTPAELEAQARSAVRHAQETSKAKFEATPEQARRTANAPIIMGGADATVSKHGPKARPADGSSAGPSTSPVLQPGEGMSRLLDAKKKAQDEMKE